MGESEKPALSTLRTDKVRRSVSQLADAGDRFVLDVAQNLQDIGVRAQAEASGMLESVGLAYDATRNLTHRLLGGERRRDAGSDDQSVGTAVTDEPGRDDLDDPDPALPMSPSGVSVVGAICGDADVDARLENGHQPGILPVLQALERILHEDAPPRGRSLERDSRFWRLIELLQVLKPPPQEESHQEKP